LAGEAGNRLMESVLLALAAICSLKEECRKQVLIHTVLTESLAWTIFIMRIDGFISFSV
jgi:hypothetical protein